MTTRGAALVLAALLTGACVEGAPDAGGQRIRAPRRIDQDDVTRRVRTLLAQSPAVALYQHDDGTPLWIGPDGRPLRRAREALDVLLEAPAEGLDSTAYSANELKARADSLANGRRDAERVAAFEADLSRQLYRYLSDLHNGRVDPRSIGLRLAIPDDEHELAGMLRTSLEASRIEELVAGLRPPLALYHRLRTALGRYRELAAKHPDWPALTPPRRAVKPGGGYAGLAAVAQRLRILGDLPEQAAIDSARYRGALVDAVKRFQGRHGIEPDGVLGKGTFDALNVSPAERVRQLALSLERLRWLPDLNGRRFIVVNIPSYQLWAWDSAGAESNPSAAMAVIVGNRTWDRRTPVFVDDMRYLIFRPYWNVPEGIAREEIVPAALEDPTYLARQDMEIVDGQTDESRVVEPSRGNLEKAAEGTLRIRQRPGERNALGLVKFIFPNDANVYLHGTPAQELFSRARRDWSHGCVRVERPVDLAEWVLRDVPGWDQGRILAAMEDSKSQRVNLATPVRVVLFYTTAIAEPDGTVEFHQDIYGHDPRLLQAMGAGALHARLPAAEAPRVDVNEIGR